MDDSNEVLLGFHVEPAGELLLPEWNSPARRDELWKTTCFEMFVKLASNDESYWEYNFSPSCEWAAYAFERYREGMRDMELQLDPHLERMELGEHFHLDADVDLAGTPMGPLIAGFSAVIEEKSGTKSYWALAHPEGKPDFHHPSCFTATLPPPGQT